MYRPKNWDEQRANVFGSVSEHSVHEDYLFEAGADAMLEALRESGVFTYGNHTPDIDLGDAPEESGYWVFIPEDNEEDTTK